MSDYRKLAKILKKSSPGEGSKGGHIIGHTRSGKPIYSSSKHEAHQSFGSQEHRDAMNQHHEIWSKTQQKISNIRARKPNWNPPKQVHDFLQHHYTQMQVHQNKASAAMDKEARHKKLTTEPSGEIKGPKPFHTPQNIHKGLNEIEVPFMAAVVIISPDKKKVLLGKRNKDSEWESPGGHADIGEHPEDVAIRECFEEFNIPLKPEQLEHLPMMYKKDMTPIHCFMAITEKYQIENVSCEDDPSEEHSKWKWFKLNEKLPDEMEDNRFNIIVHAKMKLAGIVEMTKSFLPLDDLEGMSTVNTADFENGSLEEDLIQEYMQDYQAGEEPRKIPLYGSTLFLVRVDDGMYSGFVKRTDKDGLLETVANLDKLTIPDIVKFLKAKQIILNAPKKQEISPENELKRLLMELMPKEEKMIYISMDGDNIGNKVAQAEARDDEQALMEFSRRINAGQTIFHTWAQSVGGSIIEGGGDEALAKVPESARSKVEFFRDQYKQVVGSTVTVGIGDLISHATKARELGKLKGKDRTEVYIPQETEETLKRLIKPIDPVQKLRDSGVLDLTKALQRELTHIRFELAEQLENFSKSKNLPTGSVRVWSGQKFIKQGDGHWIPMGNSSEETQNQPKQSPQNLSNVPQAGISRDANSEAVAKPRDAKIPADGAPNSQATEHKEPALKHLMPEKNGGGHVSIHSKDLKIALKQGPISIISAGRNPNIVEDKGLTDEQINKREKKLEEELKDLGYKFTKVRGHYGGAEDSFMVFNADPKELNELGKKFNQDSVIHSEKGKNKLHFTTGKNAGKHHKGEGHEEVPEAKDFYSEVPTIDGKKVKFSLGLDFGKYHPENE